MSNLLSPVFGLKTKTNLLSKYNYQLKTNDILAGTIVGIEKTQALVHLGLPQAGFLPKEEVLNSSFASLHKVLPKLHVGEFMVIYYKKKNIFLSVQRLTFMKLWERFKQVDFKNMILSTFLEKKIVGAKLASFDHLRLCLPNPHLPKYYRRLHTSKAFFKVKILEVKEKRHTIMASSRLAFFNQQSPILKVGHRQLGSVIAIKAFGIFLNLCGIKCLLHVSEISKKKEENLVDLYKKGDKISVKLFYINRQQGKIAVSAKR